LVDPTECEIGTREGGLNDHRRTHKSD
jgi:hypothetical protein